MIVKSTWTWVHACNEHKAGRIFNAEPCTAYRNHTVFNRLPHYFKYGAFKFRKFIQKQNSVVSQADLSRLRIIASSHQCNIADGMMRRSERALGDQPLATFHRFTGNAVDLGCFKGFLQSKRRQNTWKPFA